MTTMRPRVGFVGLGWIGRLRMQALVASDVADVATLWDDDPSALTAASALVPRARRARSLSDLLDSGLDGVVIATPSALHATHTRLALEQRLATFCQKPLARTRAEVQQLVALARERDRLLQVDLSYRFVRAFETLRSVVRAGRVGAPQAIDLTFHNAYGPDKPWYYRRGMAGGGCVLDLGIHLIDLLLRLGDAAVPPAVVASQLLCGGAPWEPDGEQVEDLAFVQLRLADGGIARVACSWNLPAGCDAVIEAAVYGAHAGARVRNVGGSFYDFAAERLDREGVHVLISPPDDWGGRALVDWARRLAVSKAFDHQCEELVTLAGVIDDIYATAANSRSSVSTRWAAV